MATKERFDYRERIRDFEGAEPIPLTNDFVAQLVQNQDNQADFQIWQRGEQKQFPFVESLQTTINWNKNGHYEGLEPQEIQRHRALGGPYEYQLRIWMKPDAEHNYEIRYGSNDGSNAKVVGINNHSSDLSEPLQILGLEEGVEWVEGITTTCGLPLEIDLPATVNRLVFGIDLDTGTPLTTQDIDRQPLVPFAG